MKSTTPPAERAEYQSERLSTTATTNIRHGAEEELDDANLRHTVAKRHDEHDAAHISSEPEEELQ